MAPFLGTIVAYEALHERQWGMVREDYGADGNPWD